jgi:hypothetical protein
MEIIENEIYQLAYNFLLSKKGICSEIIDKHLIPEYDKPKYLNDIYKRICQSAQNRQMLPKVIGDAIGGFDNFSKVLYDFDPKKVTENYLKTDNLILLENIIKILKPKGQIRNTSRSIWPQYCKSIIDSAYFLCQFNTSKDFYEWADYFANDVKSKVALPLLISIDITGIGFPLACDLLKELGYNNYGKPDIHLKDIFIELGIVNNENNELKMNINILRAIDTIAKSNNISSYAVDKVFWLIGSGNFYRADIKIGNNKEEFINHIKKVRSSTNIA